MKVSETCGKCGSRSKKCQIDIPTKDRDRFLAFTQKLQQELAAKGDERVSQLFIPASKYPRHPLVIPSPGEEPCGHCKIGQETIGPSGCGRGSTCLAYAYYSIDLLRDKTETSLSKSLSDFTSGA